MKKIIIDFTLVILFLLVVCICIGCQSDNNITQKNNKGTVLWKYETGGDIRSQPLYHDDTVYFTCNDGNLYALDANTGEEIWIYNTDNTILSSPVLDDTIIYFTGINGMLYAIDSATGTPAWSLSLDTQYKKDRWDYYLSTPLINDNTAYFGIGSRSFIAFDLENKEQKWAFNAGNAVHTSATLSNDIIYFGDWDGYLYAVNAQTGNEVWKYQTDGTIMSSPAVSDNIVCFGSRSCNVYALNATTGEYLWDYSHGTSWAVASPIIDNGVIYIGSSDGRFFQAIDINTGNELWKVNTDYNVFAKAALADNKVYFGSGDAYTTPGAGYVSSMDLTNRKKTIILQAGNIFSSPIVVNNTLYVGSDDHYFYAANTSAPH